VGPNVLKLDITPLLNIGSMPVKIAQPYISDTTMYGKYSSRQHTECRLAGVLASGCTHRDKYARPTL
jgi:hypothetical protein